MQQAKSSSFDTFFKYAPRLEYKRKPFKEVWLFVEKNPDHGFGASLNSLYSKRHGFKMAKAPIEGFTAMKRDVSEKEQETASSSIFPNYDPGFFFMFSGDKYIFLNFYSHCSICTKKLVNLRVRKYNWWC